MSLLEFSRCSHCGKVTWQEFVTQIHPGSSYWRCRDCGERRNAARICVGDDATLNPGRIQTSQLCANVLVVDISRLGARLRAEADSPVAVRRGDRLLFNPQLQPFGELAHYHGAIVRWINGTDFGIGFERPLRISEGDMTRIIKH